MATSASVRCLADSHSCLPSREFMFLRIAVFSLAFPICSVMTAVSIHLSMSVAVLGPRSSYRSLAQIRAR